jgi:hypothetical protein
MSPALLYHDVVEGADWDSSGFTGPRTAKHKAERLRFEAHLAAIAGANTPRPHCSRSAMCWERSLLLLTFDDGGKALPRASRGLLRNTAGADIFCHCRQNWDERFSKPEQIRSLRKAGHVDRQPFLSFSTRMSHCRGSDRRMESQRQNALRHSR